MLRTRAAEARSINLPPFMLALGGGAVVGVGASRWPGCRGRPAWPCASAARHTLHQRSRALPGQGVAPMHTQPARRMASNAPLGVLQPCILARAAGTLRSLEHTPSMPRPCACVRLACAQGMCINARATDKEHVPFRDSKLTRLLQVRGVAAARHGPSPWLPTPHPWAW